MSELRVSLFFPVFRDERSVRIVAEKALRLLAELCSDYEIIIVDDGSPDRSGEIADQLAREHAAIRVIHHETNRGYGTAVRAGLAASRFEYVCLTDGDDEYEIEDFRKLLALRHRYDLIITFRYRKIYSSTRIFISWVYNKLLRLLFRMPFRDVSTGLRMIRKSVADELALESTSPFVGAEIAIKTMLKGYPIGEVGIQTFPRAFGKGATVSVANILATMRDGLRVYRRVFSDSYDLPPNRVRS